MKTLVHVFVMLGALVLVFLIMASAQQVFGQNLGAPMPFVQPQFFSTSSGVACAGCQLFSYAAGTTTPLATYTDGTLATPNTNPIVLSTLGRPPGSGGIWLLPQAYKFVLQTALGATVWTQDNIYDFGELTLGSLPTVNCANQSGANYSNKVTACANALPSTGGTVDARALQGAQTWNSDAFSGITKPIDYLCGAATITVSNTSTLPTNVHLVAGQGCQLNVNAGITFTINGSVEGSSLSQHFNTGSGAIKFTGNVALTRIYPQWWGAVGDDSADDTPAIQAAINAARSIQRGPAFGTLTRAHLAIIFPPGNYGISSLDATGLVGINLIGEPAKHGTNFYADRQSSSKPILDLTGSIGVKVVGIEFSATTPGGATPATQPNVGILVASSNAGGDSDEDYFENIGADGPFLNEALYMFGATDMNFFNCTFSNKTQGKGAVFIGSTNVDSITSPYVTINAGTPQTGQIQFFATEFHGQNSMSATGPAIWLYNANSVKFYGGNSDSSGDQHVLLYGATNTSYLFSGMQFFSSSGHAATNAFYTNNAVSTNLTVINDDFTTGNAFTVSLMAGSGGAYTGAQVLGVPASKASIAAAYVNQVSVFNDAPVISGNPITIRAGGGNPSAFVNNGGNGSLIVNSTSTDFSSGILVSRGTTAVVSAATSAQVLALNASGGDGNAQIVTTKTASGTTKPLETFSDSTLITTHTVVSGTPQLIVGANSTDFSPGNIPFIVVSGDPVVASATSSTNATILDMTAAGGDTNAQIVTTHSGGGTTKPLEIFSDSTKLLTLQPSHPQINSITAEVGTKDALCRDSSSGEIENNSGVATCTVSSLRFKDWIRDLSCKEAKRIVKAMRPGTFKDKDGADGPRFGFAAEWTAKVDPRLVDYERDGITPRAVDYERYTAVLTRYLQCQ